jgi:hypothetical protein
METNRSSIPWPGKREGSPSPAAPRPYPAAQDRQRSVAEVVGATTGATPAAVTSEGFARRHRRQNIALLLSASVLGVWLGTGAPGASPVGPPTPTVQSAAAPSAVTQPLAVAAPSAAVAAPSPVAIAPNPVVVAPNPAVVAPNPAVVAPDPDTVAPVIPARGRLGRGGRR